MDQEVIDGLIKDINKLRELILNCNNSDRIKQYEELLSEYEEFIKEYIKPMEDQSFAIW